MDRLVDATLGSVRSVGLTGGIGSGKSTVAALLVAQGAQLVDTDAIARLLTLPGGAAIPVLRDAFGDAAIDGNGALDRTHMRQRVFSEPAVKARLEAILHPLIGEEARRQAEAAQGRPVVFDVPLLAESRGPQGWRARVDRILVVDCSEATQAARVAQRPGWSLDDAHRVIAQQASRRTRRAMADALIFNDCITLEQLSAEVAGLCARWWPA